MRTTNRYITKKGQRPCTELFVPKGGDIESPRHTGCGNNRIRQGYVLVQFDPAEPHHKPRVQLVRRNKLIKQQGVGA